MFSYIMLGTNDLPRAITFYDPLMEMLGIPVVAGMRTSHGGAFSTVITRQHWVSVDLLINRMPRQEMV